MNRLDQHGRRETYRQCPCGLIYSMANRGPESRWCSPGCRRRAEQRTG